MANSGLYRSNRQSMIAGVMGGIAERFGWNANLLRIIFVFDNERGFSRDFSVLSFMVGYS